MKTSIKRLNILSEEEKNLLYALPNLTENQQTGYFIFNNEEQNIMFSPINVSTQIYCGLQIAFFKAKKTFFNFSWDEVSKEDMNFLIENYFSETIFIPKPVTKNEYYAQTKKIIDLYGYSTWNKKYLPELYLHLSKLARKDNTINFVLTELLNFLHNKKIIIPGYTTLQDIISKVINDEYKRVGTIIKQQIDNNSKKIIESLLIRDDMLSYLAVLKQDAKDFSYKMMSKEREKLLTIKPLYILAKRILPNLDISKQNLLHYADLVNFYTVFDLRRFRSKRLYLYLLCYVWQRYMQLTDNLVAAFGYHLKKFDDKAKESAEIKFSNRVKSQQNQRPIVGQLLNLYIDESISDELSFGEVRKKYAFRLMEKESLKNTAKQMTQKAITEKILKWKTIDKIHHSFKLHLRSIFIELDFASSKSNNSLLVAIEQLKEDFLKKKKINRSYDIEKYVNIIPKKLKKYLLIKDKAGKITGIWANRYEFWIYSKIRKCLDSGDLYLDDSISHRCFEHELISLSESTLRDIDLLCFQQPIEKQLDDLSEKLKREWAQFDKVVKQNKLQHMKYDIKSNSLSFHKPKITKMDVSENTIYEQLIPVDIIDVLRFVNEECNFLSAFTPVQNRYVKNKINEDSILAVLIAQSMNYGIPKFSKIADINYDHLSDVYGQYFRKAPLQEGNCIISNTMKKLPIFEHYSYDISTLYGSVDGQKLESQTPTIKSRHSKKYFGKGRGIVSIGILVNHNPVTGRTIGPNEHESHFVFDLYYNNPTDIIPTAITGDMHSINKANFAILHWFETDFRPRFTDLKDQLKHLYCCDEISNYKNFRIKPVGQIDRAIITEEWEKIKQIIATLANKELTQSNIVKKLCKYRQTRTLKAIFEFEKLIRSMYTLKYLRDFQLQKDIHRSQNRIESYHQLRATIAKVTGKKQITGKTDIEIEINNQCGQLVANAIIYYNSKMLSLIFEKYKAVNNQKILEKLKIISPVAWQHIHLLGHYIFYNKNNCINLEKIISNIII
jgi:TnpA family transposase